VAEKLFQVVLSERDRIVARITTGHGRAVEHYSLQYEAWFDDTEQWTAVRRYDCSDRVVHVHVFSPDKPARRIEHKDLSFEGGLTIARRELLDNWERFRRTYEERRRRAP
jgi:hypothetical protein